MADYDLVVVGGGVNGVGVAQAAAANGNTVLLLEKNGLGSGTSSKSSKLIHGGLRYLESWELHLVREALLERALLLKLAPDLVQLKDFHLPVYPTMRRGSVLLYAGLSLYYLLSGFDGDARFATVPRRSWDKLDGLRTEGLSRVFRYHDAQTNDLELTRAVMFSAQQLGAELACPAKLVAAELDAQGASVTYREGATEKSCRAKVLVNAAGPWVNELLTKIRPAVKPMPVELVQGTHIIVPGELTQGCYYLESRRDGRAVFVLPWQGRVMVGTTETRYNASPDKVHALRSERKYLCGVLQHYFPHYRGLRPGDQSITDFTGLRVLPAGDKHVFHRSRETILHADRPSSEGQPRVLTIYGGKLTAYRLTAEKVMRHLQSTLPDRPQRARTDELPITPAPEGYANAD
ncbi:MAG: FAD-dependent oxidoreductase [Lysobacterales bacterium]